MRFSLRFSFVSVFFLFLTLSLVVWYKMYEDLENTKQLLHSRLLSEESCQLSTLKTAEDKLEDKTKDGDSVIDHVEKFVNKKMWNKFQHELKDTVPQIFAYVTEYNWVEPYKTPNQGEAAGTGFFINDKGEIITNAHVVDQARVVFIQIPSAGKRRFEVDVIGVSPERDLALLKLKEKDIAEIKKQINKDEIPYLKMGDSDLIARADKIMAVGYPLGQQGLKSTTGVVSGREHLSGQYFIQISAPINKGNSGGPSLDKSGSVIGVNSAGIQAAQNVGYIIPINEVKLFLNQLRAMPNSDNGPKLLRKPFLGVLFNNANENLTKFLNNPAPGGLYVVDVYKNSPLYSAGIVAGDMIYKMNGITVDNYGEMKVPWSKEERVSIVDYVSRLKIGQKVNIEFYRKGTKKNSYFMFTQSERPPIRRMYPGYEKIDYEVLGGMVIMPLTLNHVLMLAQYSPELMQYADVKKHMEPALVLTHVMLNSPAGNTRTLGAGAIIAEANGEKVKTLEQFKEALKKSLVTGYLTLKSSENIFVAIPLKEIIEKEAQLASVYFYPISRTFMELESEYNKLNSKKSA